MWNAQSYFRWNVINTPPLLTPFFFLPLSVKYYWVDIWTHRPLFPVSVPFSFFFFGKLKLSTAVFTYKWKKWIVGRLNSNLKTKLSFYMKMFILSDMFINKAAVNEDRRISFFYIFVSKHRWYEIHINIIQETIAFFVIIQLRYSHLFQSRNANAAL